MSAWNISPEENREFQQIAGVLSEEIQHNRRIHAIIFNAITQQSRALDRFLSLTDRDKVTAAVVAELAVYGYAIKHVGGGE